MRLCLLFAAKLKKLTEEVGILSRPNRCRTVNISTRLRTKNTDQRRGYEQGIPTRDEATNKEYRPETRLRTKNTDQRRGYEQGIPTRDEATNKEYRPETRLRTKNTDHK